MTSIWIDCSHPVSLSPMLLDDLDFYNFGQHFLKVAVSDMDAWIQKYLTTQSREISRRSSIIYALLNTPGAFEQCKHIFINNILIREAYQKVQHAQRPLVYCTGMLKLMQLYIEGIQNAHNSLSRIPELLEISQWIKKMLDSHSFRSILKCVEQVETIFQPLASVSIRARVLGNGDVYSFKVRDISDKDIPAISFLEKESRTVNSLLPPIRRTKHHNDIVHLESFLITQVERRWKRRIAQVEKLFMNVYLEPIKIFIETMEPIGFYLTALTFAEKMVDAGYPICRPEPEADYFEFEQLHSPHLALQGKSLPYNARLDKNKTTLITGANHVGKTTFLKSVAQSCLLAQLGFLIPAKSFCFPVVKSMYSVFASGEKNDMQKSRFEQEWGRMEDALSHTDEHSVVWINEPYTSTNPLEAVPLLRDALLGLRQNKAIHWCVTHMYDVYDLLSTPPATIQSLVIDRTYNDHDKPVINIIPKPPDGINYARAIARQYGLSVSNFINDAALLERIEDFLQKEDAP